MGRQTVMQPVSAIITGFIRLTAYMNLDAMNPMLKKGDVEISAKPDHGGTGAPGALQRCRHPSESWHDGEKRGVDRNRSPGAAD